jgi:hypothetical protein
VSDIFASFLKKMKFELPPRVMREWAQHGLSSAQIDWRSDLNAARRHFREQSGCSHAAKRPPLSTSFQQMSL